MDSTGGRWLGRGRVPSARHQARVDLRAAGGLRAGLRGGLVPLQSRSHAAVHTRSNDGPNVRAAEGRRGSRRCCVCADLARQRARLRVGVPQPRVGAETEEQDLMT